jgi:hypothetical protein
VSVTRAKPKRPPSVWSGDEIAKNLARLSRQPGANADRRFEFEEHGQLFIGAHKERLSSKLVREADEFGEACVKYSEDGAISEVGRDPFL